jgi:hypothetical protein
MNSVQHTVNMVVRQATLKLTSHGAADPRLAADQGAAVESGPEDEAGGTDMTRLVVVVVAAAVGLGALLARSVVPDVTRYLRIRRM